MSAVHGDAVLFDLVLANTVLHLGVSLWLADNAPRLARGGRITMTDTRMRLQKIIRPVIAELAVRDTWALVSDQASTGWKFRLWHGPFAEENLFVFNTMESD